MTALVDAPVGKRMPWHWLDDHELHADEAEIAATPDPVQAAAGSWSLPCACPEACPRDHEAD